MSIVHVTYGDACGTCGAVTRHARGSRRGEVTSVIRHHAGCSRYAVGPSAPTPDDKLKLWGRDCAQGCGRVATVYGGGPGAGDWAGYYCDACCSALGFDVWDRL
jgi:hypothetical protein